LKLRQEFTAHPVDGGTQAVGVLALRRPSAEVHQVAKKVFGRLSPVLHHEHYLAILFVRERQVSFGQDAFDFIPQ
jgi:hypothetical protein